MFTTQERRIFGPYCDYDGQQFFADPVAAYRALNGETNGNLAAYIDQYNGGNDRAAAILANAAVVAFGLTPFDRKTGKGTFQDEALELLTAFMAWREEKKTPVAKSPTSAPSTGPPGSPLPMPEYERKIMELARGRPPLTGLRPAAVDSTSQPSTPSG